ncbi:hypothetical protein A176_005597 [Myxococcus hansupus]|uniref:Uncharacterized protein n=1 Tax=Pseudomyxococcus hansupus TaxID=1297742 RepID=A0A0H4X512_9BACT|nr:hypothetical protein [Myxococcus hansupus]AKQ68685.1 hypothetical protein A176_005597 [Myxococcus hansupus]
MSAHAAKKPLLQKETLRQLDTAELNQLDGAVGGTTPAVTVTVPLTILTKEIIEDML